MEIFFIILTDFNCKCPSLTLAVIPLIPTVAAQLEISLPGLGRVLPAPLSWVHGAGAAAVAAAVLEDGTVTPCPCLQVSREMSPSHMWRRCKGPELPLPAVPEDQTQICMWGPVQGGWSDPLGPDWLPLTSGPALMACVEDHFLVSVCVCVCV